MLENSRCPITHAPIRHPIVVTDRERNAHRYELNAFIDYLLSLDGREPLSPASNKPIVSVGYDAFFKQILDASLDPEGRCLDYNKDIYMQRLNALLPHLRQDVNYINYLRYPSVRSTAIGVTSYLAVSLFYHYLMMHEEYPSQEHVHVDITRSYSVPIGMMTGVLDYGIRYCTNNRYTLLSTLFNLTATVIEPIKNNARDVINQIHRRHQA